MSATTPADITAAVERSFGGGRDDRLRTVLQALVRHLHAFAVEVDLTETEWLCGIEFLTATGHITDARRQEFILLSDTLGLSMLVDALAHDTPGTATESTVLGPFYVSGAPRRAYGDSIAERPSGTPAWVSGRVVDPDGLPIAGAEVDVWQNGEDRLYAVQDPTTPQENLRGRFTTRADGSYAFVGVRPTDYPIPFDGPVGRMLDATGRHPWRPAHIHMIVSAPGYHRLVTHIFDSASRHLDSDAVFAVKESLIRDFRDRARDDPSRPAGIDADWCSVESDFVLVPEMANAAAGP